MPVKWDAVKDQFMLMQLVADPSTNIGPKQFENIINAWPQETLGDAPTTRAISEHFVKIRSNLGIKGGAKVASGRSKSGAPVPATPKAGKATKVMAAPKSKAKGKTPPSKKRKTASSDEDVDDGDGMSDEASGDNNDAMAGAGAGALTPPSAGRTTLPRHSKSPAVLSKMQDYIKTEMNDGESDDDSVKDGNFDAAVV